MWISKSSNRLVPVWQTNVSRVSHVFQIFCKQISKKELKNIWDNSNSMSTNWKGLQFMTFIGWKRRNQFKIDLLVEKFYKLFLESEISKKIILYDKKACINYLVDTIKSNLKHKQGLTRHQFVQHLPWFVKCHHHGLFESTRSTVNKYGFCLLCLV